MKAVTKSKKSSTVIKACVTAVAATFALGYMLMPTPVQADEETATINTTAKNLAKQKVAAVSGISLPTNINLNSISGNVMAGASGIMAVNMIAGDKNQQVSVAVIGHNIQGVAEAQTGNLQRPINMNIPPQVLATTRIKDHAFSNVSGILAVNQISGYANIQVNSATISIGIDGEQISDSVLATATPMMAAPLTPPLTPVGERESRRAVSISETAFENASGVVQLNQTAGSHNASVNNFTLRLSETP